ncbi:binding-protein-dependent transport systems inner membrane component [Spiribacter salinus M19-40]|jgi:peptide/nickel transport system permease protein|uniref:Binding-protein-dependent transport systems inner membrane component n=1 Tax=Spiribacter salinus M19-40 TaxID=1260251 RepID=R4V4J7_9GAMM|nr:ABC transporter permease [Spiribacter salinus]AGM40874.1 binding-protein-dependent transport systems inner membrane component [Spiribacter salinus M19-40]MBY5268106.1 peptide ABC transporter permease [Spiribacter salinus]MDR9414210.1 ABC transporter permease [Spiribacter sp.]MDR9455074.1 ABC transporter permease [Spiribacter sp.]
MLRYTARRLLLLGLTLLVASVLIFAMTTVLPGDIGRIILGPFAQDEAVAALNESLGLNQPLPVQYFQWIGGVLQGDWGESLSLNTPVLPLALERLGRSLMLAALAITLLIPLAIGTGVAAGRRPGGKFDRVLSVVGLGLGAMPEFVTGVVLIVVFGIALDWFPVQAVTARDAGFWGVVHGLFLPAMCLVLLLFAYLFRMTRAGMITALEADYTRTARLKGLPERVVLRRHVLRNALLPTVTVIGAQLGWLVGGLVVVESLFRYPGIGSLLHNAASNKDIPLLAGCTLLVTLVFSIANLTADLLYGLLNPRVRDALGD